MDEQPLGEENRYSCEPGFVRKEDFVQAPSEEKAEPGPDQRIAAGPVFFEGEPGTRSRRLAWVLLALVLSGGIISAVLATGFQGEAAATKVAVPVAELDDKQQPASSRAEVVSPLPPKDTAGELSLASEPATPATDVRVVNNRREGAAARPTKPVEDAAGEKSNPQRVPAISPPALSIITPDLSPGNSVASELNRAMASYSSSQEAAPAPVDPDIAQRPVRKIIRKPGDVLQNSAVFRPRPVYAEAARAAGIKGTVTVEVTIDEEGSVIATRAISGPHELRDAAVEAARRWKWIPQRIDRNRARVVGTITFSFRD